MAMEAGEIEKLIREALPDARVTIEDLRGDGDHYAAHVVSAQFKGKTRVQQHQMVYQALKAGWAASFTRWHCRPRCPRVERQERPSNARSSRAEGVERMSDNPVFQQIERELSGSDVVLFMKGSPVFPQCGFSAAVVGVLSHLGVRFKGVDVLQDPALRQGIKEYSSWPTIPQLYVKGEFVGGCDIVREMYETGELEQVLTDKGVATVPA